MYHILHIPYKFEFLILKGNDKHNDIFNFYFSDLTCQKSFVFIYN
jgi:hypothetical protein